MDIIAWLESKPPDVQRGMVIGLFFGIIFLLFTIPALMDFVADLWREYKKKKSRSQEAPNE